MMFRNESKKVISKAKAHDVRLRQTSSEWPTSSKSSRSSPLSNLDDVPLEESEPQSGNEMVRWHDHSSPSPAVSSPTFSLMPNIEDLATGFFFSNYVIEVKGPTRGHLDHLHDIYNTYDMDENLLASMKAVGLAGYSHVTHSPQLMKGARRQYTKALRLTNEALASPTEAKKDSTLLAIMILGIFETVTGYNQKSFVAWSQHIKGAAALVSIRGTEQLRTPAGRRMFIQVCTNLLICCIQRRLPVPTHILEMRAEAARLIQIFEPGWFVQEYMIVFANFRSDVRIGVISDPQEIISKAMEIDGKLLELFSVVPPGWEYETIHTDTADPDLVYNGCYHVYYDHWVAQLWNGVRIVRMLLNEQVRELILAGLAAKPPQFLGPEYTAQVQISTDIILQMQADVLASVPQHLGFAGVKRAVSKTLLSLSSEPSPEKGQPKAWFLWNDFINSTDSVGSPSQIRSETPMIRAAGGYFLMWPLFTCGVIDLAPPSTQRWVAGLLRYIGDTMGIRQALIIAKVVERLEEIKVW